MMTSALAAIFDYEAILRLKAHAKMVKQKDRGFLGPKRRYGTNLTSPLILSTMNFHLVKATVSPGF